MSNGTEETGDIRKRLEEIEKAIAELRAGDLAIMKTMAAGLCEAHCNIFTLFQKGADAELWAKKLAEAKQTIQGSETIEDVIKTRDNFIKDVTEHARVEAPKAVTEPAQAEPAEEIAEPVKAEKADNADDAMDIACTFMKKDNSVALPLKVERRDDIWVVDVDVGAVRMEIVRVKVDAKTGEILGHKTVEKK